MNMDHFDIEQKSKHKCICICKCKCKCKCQCKCQCKCKCIKQLIHDQAPLQQTIPIRCQCKQKISQTVLKDKKTEGQIDSLQQQNTLALEKSQCLCQFHCEQEQCQCSRKQTQSTNEESSDDSSILLSKIQIQAIQVVRPEHDSTLYKKLHISIILDKLNDQARKMVRFLSSQFSMNLYESWQNFIAKNKKIQPNFDQLLIINEKSQQKMIRQLKINPSLRVILYTYSNLSQYCQQLFKQKQYQNYMMITDSPSQITNFLIKNKKRLIVTTRR